ncbi:SDR family oxidoreductase [Kerstersia sp.]|uniref:SDR family oxidoreductase n=1 Tax=Kerstersia sp. TaxID=1930783 RepID=UPI003F90A6E3
MNQSSFSSGLRRAVLITGAARRMGSAIALGFAQRGWDVVIHHRASPDEAQATADAVRACGVRAVIVTADLAEEGAAAQLFEDALAAFGQLDAVVNNASRFDYDDADSFGPDLLFGHMQPNLVAPVALARGLARHVRARQGKGVVINLLDQKLWNYNPDFFSYTLSKAALESATTMLAQALAPHVRVVGIAPGLTLPSHLQTPEAFEQTHRLAPLGQASTAADIADAAVFMAHNPAITGTTLLVDGGQHLVGFARDFSMMAPGPEH